MHEQVNITVTNGALNTEYLNGIGLTAEDATKINTIKNALNTDDMNEIVKFGGDASKKTIEMADKMLSNVRCKDLENAGSSLTAIVVAANSVNIDGLNTSHHNYPLIGPIIKYFDKSKMQITAQFETANAQIDNVIEEVKGVSANLATRNKVIDEAYEAVKDEYYEIGLRIAAGKIRVSEMDSEIFALSQDNLEGLESQKLFDLKNKRELLDKRTSDLLLMQKSAEQSLPQFRMTQQGNIALIEKFNTINAIVIPAWRRGFITQLALEEQKSAVELADLIDEATNQNMKRQSKLLKQNAIKTAKANQRLSIDIKTLKQVQKDLLDTISETAAITEQGLKNRAEAEQQCIDMRREFNEKLISDSAVAPIENKMH